MSDPEWAERSDYSALAWGNRVKAARLKVELDRRRGKSTPGWIQELAEQDVPDIPRPTKRRGSAA